ncbi:MAG: leucine-rich repeat protein, partial [Paludibacteraceae bacterium]|nr:leucine-rich repeat protein [Paludibacteraceae bacterium]
FITPNKLPASGGNVTFTVETKTPPTASDGDYARADDSHYNFTWIPDNEGEFDSSQETTFVEEKVNYKVGVSDKEGLCVHETNEIFIDKGEIQLPLYQGQCGESLYWEYAENVLTITGTGAMYDYSKTFVPWNSFVSDIRTVKIEEGVTSVGSGAFSNHTQLNKLILSSSITTIGEGAFAGCRALYDIYCYASMPPMAETTSFFNYNAYFYVICESKRYYQVDMVFGNFKNVQCISNSSSVINAKAETQDSVRKEYRDGQVLIIKGDKTYTMFGKEN